MLLSLGAPRRRWMAHMEDQVQIRATPRYQQTLVALLGLALCLSLVRPMFPREQLLQHAPTVAALALLLYSAGRRWISDTAMTCVVVFLLLHVIGARYIYSYVPLGEHLSWLALGAEASGRNHYDRLVHLAFGVLAIQPLVEVSRRFGGLGFGGVSPSQSAVCSPSVRSTRSSNGC